MLETIHRRLDAAFRPRRVLDFGCGVGRVLIPLAQHAEAAVGVDVSVAMMEEAAHNCEERDVRNVTFIRSDDGLSRIEGSFDLIHSSIVFQHIAQHRVEVIVRNLLGRLEPGGVGVLQFTTWAPLRKRIGRWLKRALPPINVAANLARGRPWNLGLIEMNCFPFERIMDLLTAVGIVSAFVDFEHTNWGPGNDHGVVMYFRCPKVQNHHCSAP